MMVGGGGERAGAGEGLGGGRGRAVAVSPSITSGLWGSWSQMVEGVADHQHLILLGLNGSQNNC